MHRVEEQLRAYADWVQRSWPGDDVAGNDDPPCPDEPAVSTPVGDRRSNRPLLLAAVLVAVAGIGVVAFLAFGSRDRDTVRTTSATTPPASTETRPPTPTTSPDRAYPSWEPDHLSGDGHSLTIRVEGDCGQRYEGVETTVDERGDRVEIVVTARPLEFGEACILPAPPITLAEVTLAEPLGEREIVDAADPERALQWVVEPGSVSARVVLRSEEGAVAPDVPSDLFLVLGLDTPMVPLRVDQVRNGTSLPVPLTFRPGAQHVGVFGSIDRLPLSADTFEQQGSIPIPPPDPAIANQQLVLTLQPGAVTAEGRVLVLDPTRVTVTWIEQP